MNLESLIIKHVGPLLEGKNINVRLVLLSVALCRGATRSLNNRVVKHNRFPKQNPI